jgi:3-dehydroquinate dehydratase / shikimate dehydrogenase
MATLVCVSLLVEDPATSLREAHEARDGGADLVEFRVDGFFSGGSSHTGTEEPAGEPPTLTPPAAADHGDDAGLEYEIRQIVALVAESPLPCIVTCRPTSEGGHYDGDEPARIALFERLGTAFGEGEHPPRFLDVELATYTRSANVRQKINLAIEHPEQLRDVKTSLMISIHDFGGRPADLSRQLLGMQREPAAKILKIAYRARSLRDNLELFELLAHRDRPMIALGMGEFGLMSRVLAGKFGAFLTFAGVRSQSTTAPGQPSLRELLDLYRFRDITAGTRVYGVIGYPITQSLSPHIHNAGFEAIGHDGVYLPLPVVGGKTGHAGAYESLKATLGELAEFAPLQLSGVSVTRPHKENLVRLAGDLGWELDAMSTAAGAANTLTLERDAQGHLTRARVSNTDAPALIDCLRETAGELRGRPITILGSGGVARAAMFALLAEGARVTVCGRNHPRAQAVAAAGATLGDSDHPPTTAHWETRERLACDIYINCTPLGMAAASFAAEIPLPDEALSRLDPRTVIMDTVYNPAETPLLRSARRAGLRTVDGVSMFVRQATAQFSGWTGAPAPLALFERIVREHLAG